MNMATKAELEEELENLEKKKGKGSLSKEEELALISELAEKHGLSVASVAKIRSKKGKVYASVKCLGGCNHIFRRRWTEHVTKAHGGKDPGFTERGIRA